jgi:hypothetical protein
MDATRYVRFNHITSESLILISIPPIPITPMINTRETVAFHKSIILSQYEGDQSPSSGDIGQLRYNKTTHQFEGYHDPHGADYMGSRWRPFHMPLASHDTPGGIRIGANLHINPTTGILDAAAPLITRYPDSITLAPHTASNTGTADYYTLSDALAYIAILPPATPIIILLLAGSHILTNATITLPPYITLRGHGNRRSILTGGTLIIADHTTLHSIVLQNISCNLIGRTTLLLHDITFTSSTIHIENSTNITLQSCDILCEAHINIIRSYACTISDTRITGGGSGTSNICIMDCCDIASHADINRIMRCYIDCPITIATSDIIFRECDIMGTITVRNPSSSAADALFASDIALYNIYAAPLFTGLAYITDITTHGGHNIIISDWHCRQSKGAETHTALMHIPVTDITYIGELRQIWMQYCTVSGSIQYADSTPNPDHNHNLADASAAATIIIHNIHSELQFYGAPNIITHPPPPLHPHMHPITTPIWRAIMQNHCNSHSKMAVRITGGEVDGAGAAVPFVDGMIIEDMRFAQCVKMANMRAISFTRCTFMDGVILEWCDDIEFASCQIDGGCIIKGGNGSLTRCTIKNTLAAECVPLISAVTLMDGAQVHLIHCNIHVTADQHIACGVMMNNDEMPYSQIAASGVLYMLQGGDTVACYDTRLGLSACQSSSATGGASSSCTNCGSR